MKFYNRHFESGYEELIAHYPRYYREVLEMVEILKTFGRLTEELEGHIEQTYLNNFILYADEETISVWEQILHITYAEPLTLLQRKCVVIAWLSGHGHIGEPEIRDVIAYYTDKGVTVDFDGGVITVVIEGEPFGEANLHQTLLVRIPAHLRLSLWVHVRRAFRQNLKVHFGGATGAALSFIPIGEDRTAILPVSVFHGGFSDQNIHCIPTDAEKNADAQMTSAGGIYYHTHTKTKLIG